jgi:hypothetical protein
MVDNVIGELFTIIALASGSHRSRDSRATQKPGCSPLLDRYGSLELRVLNCDVDRTSGQDEHSEMP